MLPRTWWLVRGLAAVLILGVTLAVAAQDQDTGKKKKAKQADPPRTTTTMNQMRGLFARWDTNKDDFLDKKELAIAFRGAGARPYDWRETKDKDKADEKKDDDKTDEKK